MFIFFLCDFGSLVRDLNAWDLKTTLPKTNFLHLKIGRAPRGNSSEPNPVIQVRAVSSREGKWNIIAKGIHNLQGGPRGRYQL